MEIFLGIMFFILGACFGSFINMLEYRLAVSYGLKPKKRKLKIKDENRSFCDYCGRQLRWYENIPIFSWLVQEGKTRCCKKKLPVTYPLMELISGITFLLIFVQNNGNWRSLLLLLAIAVVFLFEFLFDLKYMILPDVTTAILLVLVVILSGISWNNLGAALGSFLFLLALHVTTRGKGMGFGDVKLAFVMGILLGAVKVTIAFYLAFIVGAIVGLLLILLKKVGRKTQIPFGPFLIMATLIAFLYGDNIWYLASTWIK